MNRGRREAFSLIEVLVSLSVSAALLTLLLTLIVRATGFWDRSSNRLAAEGQARLVLDQLEADFQSILWQREGGGWLIATIQPDQPATGGHAGMERETWASGEGGIAKPAAIDASLRLASSLEHYRFGQAGVWLRLIALRPSDGEARPLPVAVAYQMVRREAAEGVAPVYQFFRSRVTALATFEAGYDLDATVYRTGDAALGVPGNVRRPPAAALLATGVIDFGVRLLRRDEAAGEVVLFPRLDALEWRSPGDGPVPEVAELFVRVLTAEGVRQLGRKEYPASSYAPSEGWWEIAERHSIVSTRRIALHVRSL